MDEENGGIFEGAQVIKLDGTMGVGQTALVTIITKDETLGEKEETFQFPYSLIDQENLQKFTTYGMILGYKLVKQPKREGQ